MPEKELEVLKKEYDKLSKRTEAISMRLRSSENWIKEHKKKSKKHDFILTCFLITNVLSLAGLAFLLFF